MSMDSIVATYCRTKQLVFKTLAYVLVCTSFNTSGDSFCSPIYSSASEVCGSLLAGERPRRDFEEINDIMQ